MSTHNGDWNRNLQRQRDDYLRRERAKRIATGLAEQAKVYPPADKTTQNVSS